MADPAASNRSPKSRRRQEEDDENTPLLIAEARPIDDEEAAIDEGSHGEEGTHLLGALPGSGEGKSRTKWSSLIALMGLCLVVILIMVLGFMTPEIMKEYAQEAVVFEPESLSVPAFTATGAIARLKGTFRMDGARVRRKPIRDLGRFGSWIAREVKTSAADVVVYLPEYGNVVLGTAKVPSIKVNIRDGKATPIDFTAELTPGPPDGIRQLADDFLQGRLGQISVRGKTSISLQSGLIHVPKTTITKSIVFDNDQLPKLPSYDLSRLNIHEVEEANGEKGLSVDVSACVKNDWPFDFAVPRLSFAVGVNNCRHSDPNIMLADAETKSFQVRPKEDIHVSATGYVWSLPEELLQNCPKSKKSPLDMLLGGYINGETTTVYVSGSKKPAPETPKWISDLVSDITVPLPLAGRQLGNLIRNFSLADVHFSLPDPFAEPDTADGQPRISAKINAIVNLPEEMNFPVNVSRVRSDADVYYHGSKLGRLDLHKWQKANSTRIEAHKGEKPGLVIEANVDNAPLWIRNETLFSEIVQKLLFGSSKPVILTIKADVDVEVETALGTLTVQEVPAEGVVPVKPISNGGKKGPGGQPDIDGMDITFGNLSVIESTLDSMTLGVLINITNPTEYAATVPYLDINLVVNNTILGHGRVENISVKPGNNSNIPVKALWSPLAASGPHGRAVGRELLSQYLSGFNTTLTLQAHRDSIPSLPAIGDALSHLNFTFPTPRLRTPRPDPDDPTAPSDGNEDEEGHFIHGATMHLVSSTALFTLASPLQHTTIYLTSLNATAFYKGDRVGHILHSIPFAVPPGISETPRLKVDWSLGSVGFEAVRNALGGRLRLEAKADVGVRIGRWEEKVWFLGRGIGAKVRL